MGEYYMKKINLDKLLSDFGQVLVDARNSSGIDLPRILPDRKKLRRLRSTINKILVQWHYVDHLKR